MARQKKEGQSVTVRISKDLYERFDEFCERKGHSKTWVVETAIREYMDREDALKDK